MITLLTNFAQYVQVDGQSYQTNLPTVSATQSNITVALQLVFGLLGTIAIIYLLYQAIKFTTSQGDPQTISKARQGIIFALVGLAIAVSAEVIVTFVIGQL